MDERDWRRFEGFRRLVHDGVEQGAGFVEKHHRQAAEKPFGVLQSITPIAAPVSVVRCLHDGVLSLTYGSIRTINQVAGVTGGWIVGLLAPRKDG